ncbi:MAG: hypothetical protein ACLPH3_11605 [Terracidiphilus sp.]
MDTDRRAILSLVALGRITPREAERLFAVCPNGDDALLRLALCLAFAALALPGLNELFFGITHVLAALMPALHATVHHTLACVAQVWGGIL